MQKAAGGGGHYRVYMPLGIPGFPLLPPVLPPPPPQQIGHLFAKASRTHRPTPTSRLAIGTNARSERRLGSAFASARAAGGRQMLTPPSHALSNFNAQFAPTTASTRPATPAYGSQSSISNWAATPAWSEGHSPPDVMLVAVAPKIAMFCASMVPSVRIKSIL